MSNIGGGSFLDADFKDFAGDCSAPSTAHRRPPTIEVTKTASPTTIGEPGGNVTFTVDVHNLASMRSSSTALVDDVYGNLDGKGTCDTGGTIAAGDTYTCHFSGAVAGAPGSSHTDTVTADASNDNGKATDHRRRDRPRSPTSCPTIGVDKTARPSRCRPAAGRRPSRSS